MSVGGWFLVALAVIASLAVFSAVLHWFGQGWWWWRDRDTEQLRGLGVLVGVLASFGVVIVMLFLPNLRPWVRVISALVSIGLALLLASSNWTRSVLRQTVLVLLVLTALIVVQIGRDDVVARPAKEAVIAARTTRQRLQAPADTNLARLRTARHKALDTLDATIRATPRVVGELSKLATKITHDLKAKRVNRPQLARDVNALHHHPALNIVSASKARKGRIRKAEAQLRKAVATAVAANTALHNAPRRKNLNAAIVKASCILRATTYARVELETSCKKHNDGSDLDAALANLRLRVAEYQQAVLKQPLDAVAVKTAKQDLEALTTTLVDHDVSVLDSLRGGAEAVVSTLPGQHTNAPVALEAFGLTLAAALALGFWRRIERRSAQQMPGPVTIGLTAATDPSTQSDSTKSNGDETAASSGASPEQLSIFRVAILQNLPEPAAAPGAGALTQLTDLAELAGVAATGMGKVLAAIKNIVARPGGYVVTALVVAPSGFNQNWQVLTRIADQWSGDQIAVRTLTDKTAESACRAAGYWAAAKILSRSSRIPGWTSWDEGTEKAFAAYQEGEYLPIDALELAVSKAPTSGLLLSTLANTCDLAGRHLDALVLNARAVVAHPHFWIAHYRLAVSAAMVKTKVEDEWIAIPHTQRVRVTQQIERACSRLNLRLDAATPLSGLLNSDADVARRTLTAINVSLLKRLEDNAKPMHLLARLLRKDERIVWWPVARSLFTKRKFGSASRAKWLPLSARLINEATDEQLEDTRNQAGDPKSWWQLSYNLACYYANSNPDEALRWLEIALEHPGSQQMAADWIGTDPDLESLRTHPRFKWVIRQLQPPARSATDG